MNFVLGRGQNGQALSDSARSLIANMPIIPPGVVDFKAQVMSPQSTFRVTGVQTSDFIEGTIEEFGNNSTLFTNLLPTAVSSGGQVTVSSNQAVNKDGSIISTHEDSSGNLDDPFTVSIQTHGYKILIDGQHLQVNDVRTDSDSNSEDELSFTVTSPSQDAIDGIVAGFGGGAVHLEISSGGIIRPLKLIPPRDKQINIISWENVDSMHAKIICKSGSS